MTALLPSMGICQACYLLANAARIAPHSSFDEWVERARRIPAGHSGSWDIEGVAAALVECGLVEIGDDHVEFTPGFPTCSDGSDRLTRLKIAKALLSADPPDWLLSSAMSIRSLQALIPVDAMSALSWLGDDLAILLADLRAQSNPEHMQRAIGWIGEEVVTANELARGCRVIHVSEISDRYGYDVRSEDATGTVLRRLEIKCTMNSGSRAFYLTRNEYASCQKYHAEWLLVQVILRAERLWTQETITAACIDAIRWVPPGVLWERLVVDTEYSQWRETVRVELPDELWTPMDRHLPNTWSMPNPVHDALSRSSS